MKPRHSRALYVLSLFCLASGPHWLILYWQEMFSVNVLASSDRNRGDRVFWAHEAHESHTPKALLNHIFSCADSWTVNTGSPAHGVPHLSQVSTLRLTRSVSHASLRASLGSHLPHYSFYWSLGNLIKCFEESVTNKSRCPLTHFFFFNPKYYI